MLKTKNTKAFYKTEIPSDWSQKKIADVAKIYDGTHTTPNYVSSGVPFYSVEHVTSNRFDDTKYISEEVFAKESERVVLEKGDILMTRIGDIGTTRLIDWDVRASFYVSLALIKTKDINVDAQFISHFINSNYFQRELYQRTIHVAFPKKINLGEIGECLVAFPPLPEQRTIAQVLSTADAAIHTTEKLIAQKELRKKWLMQQLLTGKLRLRSASGERFGGEWKEMHLGEMFTERNETKFFDLPLLSIGQNGVYLQDESVKKDTSNEDKSKYKRICPGDIGYNTMRMWQGRSALSDLEGIVSPAYTVVTAKKNADSLFFSYLFKMTKMTNLFWRNSQGLVNDTLNCKFKDFNIVKVNLPPTKEEQTAIARVLQAADKEISLLKAKAEKLREQKKGLMQQLLTGKVRLKIKE